MECADALVMDHAKRKAEISKKDEDGWSVIYYACLEGRKELVKWLLEKSASAKEKSKENLTPLMIAAQNGSVKVGKLLLRRFHNIDQTTSTGDTALMIAITHQREDFANW